MVLPDGSKMTVPLNPGTGGLKELILSHDPVEKNKQITVKVTVKHKGSKDGSDPKSFECNGELIRPYSKKVFRIPLKKRKKFTELGTDWVLHFLNPDTGFPDFGLFKRMQN